MTAPLPAAEAIAILRASGVNAQKSSARGRCRTLCYLVAGQYVNLGRLRELARDAMAAAETAPEAPAAPVNVDAIARDAGRAYETACLARYADPSGPEAQYVAAMEGRRATRAARIAATLAHANGADVAGVRAAAADAVAQLAAFDAAAVAR